MELVEDKVETQTNVNEPLVLKGNPNEYVYSELDKVEVEGQLITELKNLLTGY